MNINLFATLQWIPEWALCPTACPRGITAVKLSGFLFQAQGRKKQSIRNGLFLLILKILLKIKFNGQMFQKTDAFMKHIYLTSAL